MKSIKHTKVAGIVIVLSLLSFVALVWPTRYRHAQLSTRNESFPVRIDRFTGKAEMLTTNGWYCIDKGKPLIDVSWMKKDEKPGQQSRVLSREELEKHLKERGIIVSR